MNQKTIQENHRRVYDTLDKSYHYKEGTIKINTHNTIEHEISKFIVCWELAQNKIPFLTEPIFKNGLRGDIINLNTAEVIELTHTEIPDGHKEENYPLPILYMKSTKIINYWGKKYFEGKDD